MPQICQTVTFTKQDVQNLLMKEAKEHLKELTGKEPVGSSQFKFCTAEGDTWAEVQFNGMGKR